MIKIIRGFTIVVVFDLVVLSIWEIQSGNIALALLLAGSALLHVISDIRRYRKIPRQSKVTRTEME